MCLTSFAHRVATTLLLCCCAAVRFLYAYRFLATVGGRVDINKESGLAVYKRPPGAVGWTKLTPGGSLMHNLFHTGVTGSPQVKKGGKLMMITAISYIIIQVRGSLRLGGCLHYSAFFFVL